MRHVIVILSVFNCLLVLLKIKLKANATFNAMNSIPYLSIILINKTHAFEIDGNQYRVRKGLKASRNISEIVSARSVISGASQCARTNGFTHANYRAATCELLNYELQGIEIGLEIKNDAKFICRYNL